MLDNWQTFARHLSERYTVFTIDLRNHGRSPHSAIFNYPVLAEDIVEFIHHHKLDEVTLLGHSLGGKTAMQSALAHPALVHRLIVIDIAPKAYASGHDVIIDALQGIDPGKAASRSAIETQLVDKLQDIGVVRFLMKNIGRREDGTLYWRMNLPVLADNYINTTAATQAPTSYTGPVLFVRGGRSRYILDEDWPLILDLFPAARLETIADAGHWVHADAMDALLELTKTFMEEI
jgi:pimeloyl-ACP methyl ester carboxylesterase